MNKAIYDFLVIAVALIVGGAIAIMDNPLTATFAFVFILGCWELAKYIPTLLSRDQEMHDN